jgi:hypothetical protein
VGTSDRHTKLRSPGIAQRDAEDDWQPAGAQFALRACMTRAIFLALCLVVSTAAAAAGPAAQQKQLIKRVQRERTYHEGLSRAAATNSWGPKLSGSLDMRSAAERILSQRNSSVLNERLGETMNTGNRVDGGKAVKNQALVTAKRSIEVLGAADAVRTSKSMVKFSQLKLGMAQFKLREAQSDVARADRTYNERRTAGAEPDFNISMRTVNARDGLKSDEANVKAALVELRAAQVHAKIVDKLAAVK